ncbi:diguanylate cyclase [Colwellia sp. MEBiC06753]
MSFETSQINELHWLMEMLHNIDVGLVVLDREYNIQIWNGFMENHSGLLPREAKGQNLFSLFDEIPEQWFRRKAESVFLLKNKAFTIWEQRPYLFKFQNYRPITGSADYMYQNSTFIPLLAANGTVSHLCLIIYDVTDTAIHKKDLQQVNQELALLNQTDGLTQLYNRTHWESCLLTQYKRWLRSQHDSCLVMLDIDHFKRINDGYGHMVGDQVIRHIAFMIKEHVRETDIAGRYGGEEFSIWLADTTLANAKVFAERLRKSVEQTVVKYNDIDISYTISIGICQISPNIQSFEAWIECADAALYQAKEAGRNCIKLYPIQGEEF